MKRWIRGILYLVAGCAGVAAAAFILALLLGGTKKQLDDVRNVAARVTQMGKGTSDSQNTEYWEDGKSLVYDGAEVESLTVKVKRGEIQILESDSDQIQVKSGDNADSKDVSVKCEKGALVIEDTRSGKQNYKEDIAILLKLPKKQFSRIELSVNAGVLTVEQALAAETMILNADAGEIEAESLRADEFTANVGAGSVSIDEAEFGSARMECGMGELELCASFSKDSDISCGMGEVDLTLINGIDSMNYEISCGMGEVEIGERTYHALAKETTIASNAAATLKLDCGMGSISVENK